MEKELPKYFTEYLEEKFSSLGNLISDNSKITQDRLNELEKTQKMHSYYIWFAMGGIVLIFSTGFLFSSLFKAYDQQQIEEILTSKNSEIAQSVVDTLTQRYSIKINK